METEPFRCFTLPGTLPQNGEGIFGLEGIGDFHDNELQWFRAFRGDQRSANFYLNIVGYDEQGRGYLNAQNLRAGNNFLNLANVKYYLTRQAGQILPIENEQALGRISFAHKYVVMNEEQALAALRDNRYDIHTTVALLEEPAIKPAPIPAAGDSSASPAMRAEVTWVSYTPNVRTAEVIAPTDGFLRISEVYYPGWEIRIDGEKVRDYRADVSWIAVNITRGKHTVEMRPRSLYLREASMVSLPLIGVLLAYWIVVALMQVRSRKKETAEGTKA